MIRISQIKIPVNLNSDIYAAHSIERLSELKRIASKVLKISEGQIFSLSIIKHSVDARKKPELYDVYTVDVAVGAGKSSGKSIDGASSGSGRNSRLEEQIVKKARDRNVSLVQEHGYSFMEKVLGKGDDKQTPDLRGSDALKKAEGRRICIIGAGPAGLFCGYELAMAGLKPIILERGADVDGRLEAVQKFWETGELNIRTNVQFGEGGAGTFSDGKLNTMVKDKEGRGAEALDIFVKHGAPERIKYESKPHIGTDILTDVVRGIRNSIITAGGEVHFESRVTDIVLDENGAIKALKVVNESSDGSLDYNGAESKGQQDEWLCDCDAAVLAIGHSARDTFEMLYEKKVDMQTKPFAVGFRVEHPQSIINKSQYGIADPKSLPAAPYKLTTTTKEGRGVYSFCMCPGGYVVNASSEKGMLAVNGMSYSKRDGRNANSAIIITVDPKDFGSDHVLSGVEFQRRLEKKAYELADGKIPVEYYGDFKAAVTGQGIKTSVAKNEDVPDGAVLDEGLYKEFTPQMKGSYAFSNVHEILPEDLNEAFVEGIENFGRIIKGYNDGRALVSGVESRTSSPVRIVRNDTGQSPNVKGLFPCGEGAGYAGGIMSAAMDGIRTAELVARKIIIGDNV